MFPPQLEFDVASGRKSKPASTQSFVKQVRAFRDFGEATKYTVTESPAADGSSQPVETLVNEFWTARQRQGSSLHEISYRACFKPQLPRFFIERLTAPGDVVYDPFMGRGTTPIEAALLGRVPFGCDINPLSLAFVPPRLRPPTLNAVAERLAKMELSRGGAFPEELLVFYHPETLRDIVSLKEYFLRRQREGTFDALDGWIRLVSINRLTGHSNGFFSVYTLPPNQAVSIKSQTKINADRQQVPTPRDVRKLILKKSKQLLGDCDAVARKNLEQVADRAIFVNSAAHATPQIASHSVALVVTSPPFLDVVDYATDNWLRCWFLGIDAKTVKITVPKKLEIWTEAMTAVFRELHRVLKPGGHVAFEVGEVRGGKVRLEEAVLPCGREAGLEPVMVLINDQEFTKTANCWGVDNNAKGTNTNRIVLFQKPV
ncbi:MAG: site-specific DNA-methyltransferase [Opitutaceae bacterium]|nr:site-specific DNA-methyltransferase [Verrucomicrobiales bacterium]